MIYRKKALGNGKMRFVEYSVKIPEVTPVTEKEMIALVKEVWRNKDLPRNDSGFAIVDFRFGYDAHTYNLQVTFQDGMVFTKVNRRFPE